MVKQRWVRIKHQDLQMLKTYTQTIRGDKQAELQGNRKQDTTSKPGKRQIQIIPKTTHFNGHRQELNYGREESRTQQVSEEGPDTKVRISDGTSPDVCNDI